MVRLILKITKPIKNQVKGAVAKAVPFTLRIVVAIHLPWFSCGLISVKGKE